jgi:glycine/D-amino acid oxidase-like deaminating enzyme
MTNVVVIGCGVVGAAIAYELSQIPGLTITVLDRQPPAQAATGAALGVLMGVISQKIKGKAWQMRLASIQRYDTLIPELEAIAGHNIPFNQQGILKLCFTGEDLTTWEKLVKIRQSQGWQLEILHPAQLQSDYPQLCHENIMAAVYSPQVRQVNPTVLTLALVAAAQRNGVGFQFGTSVQDFVCSTQQNQSRVTPSLQVCQTIQTDTGSLAVDWVVVAAGLGSTPLTAMLKQPLEIKPVLGQALQVHLDQPLGHLHLQPVITGDDVHIVPLGQGDYWVGATVEFPTEEPTQGDIEPNPARLQAVMQQSIAFCPALAQATVLRSWSGLRPRPEGRPAPVIGALPGYSNILLATGHYRNGVLLAPATAQAVREAIVNAQLASEPACAEDNVPSAL